MHLGSGRGVWAPRVHQLPPLGTPPGRGQGCERHVCVWDGCDTHEPLRWPEIGLGRGWGQRYRAPRKRKNVLGEEEGRLWCVRPCWPLFLLLALRG